MKEVLRTDLANEDPSAMIADPAMQFDELRREMRSLEGRDLQLWSIGLLVLLVVAAGFVAILLPNVAWGLGVLRLEGRYLPQLLFGFIALIVLFNIYLLQQRWMLARTRDQRLYELLRREAAERLSLVDPLTEIYNRRFLNRVVQKEIYRAGRLGTDVTFLMVDVDGFKSVNSRLGHLAGDRLLKEVARVLKETFRVSDTILRYGGDEFLVILTETSESQAERAITRLLERVARWNRENADAGYRMSLSCGKAAYTKGTDVSEVLDTADQRMYLHKARHAAAS